MSRPTPPWMTAAGTEEQWTELRIALIVSVSCVAFDFSRRPSTPPPKAGFLFAVHFPPDAPVPEGAAGGFDGGALWPACFAKKPCAHRSSGWPPGILNGSQILAVNATAEVVLNQRPDFINGWILLTEAVSRICLHDTTV
jgi:hypothetical protein